MSFTPRVNDVGLDTLDFYKRASGYNPFPLQVGNCTWYAWGRFWECGDPQIRPDNLGYVNGLYTDAYLWYNGTQGYSKGQTPKLGAVICYSGGNYSGLGHVAVVEQIYPDGKILVSESGWDAYYFRTRVADPNNSYPYSNPTDGYTFQGFIYNPTVHGGDVPPEPSNWITGNRFLSRAEQDNNAIKFYYEMSRLGISYNAIIGMLANIELESTINPGIWEGLNPYSGGYGLVQWTPYTKYSNWAGSGWENNGAKECERIYYESQNDIQWFANPSAGLINLPVNPPINFAEFVTSYDDYVTLADYWLLYYEHPYEGYIVDRHNSHQSICDYYNDLLGGGSPPQPIIKTSKLMLYVNKRKFMKRRGLAWR